jgi:hypothetical protein
MDANEKPRTYWMIIGVRFFMAFFSGLASIIEKAKDYVHLSYTPTNLT